MFAIGKKLRNARKTQNLSLRELSGMTEISASMLSQIENGKATPSVRSLHSIADALNVPFDYFFPNKGDSKPTTSLPLPQGEAFTASDMRQRQVDSQLNGEFDEPVTTVIRGGDVLLQKDRPSIELKGGVTWFRLTAETDQDAEFLEIIYQPGASSGANMSHHVGREFGLVVEGELLLELGFDTYTLQAGDSVIFDSNTPHRLTNPCDTPMRAFWVVINSH